MAAGLILLPTMPSNFTQKIRNKMNRFWKMREKPYFWTRRSMNALFIALFLGKPIAVLIWFIIWHILRKNEQNRLNGSWDIDEKVIFERKMPPLWKIQNFR